MKLSIGVIRKYTPEGFKLLRFEIAHNPVRVMKHGEKFILEQLSFDTNEKMEDVFHRIFGRPYCTYITTHSPCYIPPDLPVSQQDISDKEDEKLTWAFCIDVPGVEELEQLDDIQSILSEDEEEHPGGGARNILKYLLDLHLENGVWATFEAIMEAIIAENIPPLIPYGESEMSMRKVRT